MSYRDVFSKQHSLIVVVHVENFEQAARNTKCAFENGADGVFLINHNISYGGLLHIYDLIRVEYFDEWIGVNCLDISSHELLKVMGPVIDGIWSDNAGIYDEGVTQKAHQFLTQRNSQEWSGLYFGGVAFKGQHVVTDLKKAAKLAVPYVDVVTTSGSATGIAADVTKIKTMKEALGDFPLAIASGITAANIADYMPFADCFLVASGISDSHTELNARKVHTLANKINA